MTRRQYIALPPPFWEKCNILYQRGYTGEPDKVNWKFYKHYFYLRAVSLGAKIQKTSRQSSCNQTCIFSLPKLLGIFMLNTGELLPVFSTLA